MMADVLPGSRALSKPKDALVRLFGAKPPSVLDELAGRSDPAIRALFDGAVSGLLLIDITGRIARANPALRAMLVDDIDLTAGAPAALIFVEADRAAAWQKLQALLAGRIADCRLTARLRLADPAPDRRADIGGRLLHEADGTVAGLMLRITDITAQVRLETQLAQSREVETVGHLVGGVAHDFNNLLTAILGAVELVQERGPDAAIRVELEHIRRGAERGAALVRNLLALGRQQYLQTTPLDVNRALDEFAAMIRPALGRDIVLDLDLEEPGRRVRADPGQLDQVLMNLAMNARNAMPSGGRLTLRSGHATLYRKQVHGRETIAPGRYVTITVQDTGAGIPPELMGRVFDPFFTTRRAEGGTGLGLATAHGIISQTGGFLTVESEVGQGTMFRIYLPREENDPVAAEPGAAQPAAGPHPPAPAPPRIAASVRRVLLVDDEDAVRRITARALAKHGWQVSQAESAEAATALLDADPALALSVLVSDVVMPGKDGAALVEDVRARYPALPAILVSGYTERALADRFDASVTFLGKPYTPRTLLARLAEIVPEGAPAVVRMVSE
jgi:two-component system cell cycle sensor histidine kinase/response regulator CckA